MRTRVAVITLSLLLSSIAIGQEDLSLAAISARHPAIKMSDAELARLRAEGDAWPASKRSAACRWTSFNRTSSG